MVSVIRNKTVEAIIDLVHTELTGERNVTHGDNGVMCPTAYDTVSGMWGSCLVNWSSTKKKLREGQRARESNV